MNSVVWLVVCMSIMMLTPAVALPQGNVQVDYPLNVRGLARFDDTQQQDLQAWLNTATMATEQVVGSFPFAVTVHLHPRRGNEPVPWANTWREDGQAVHFYVDTRFPRRAFEHDWTAYHEFAHLALPYLGSRNRWFAEGFASFMQYPIMASAGTLDVSPGEAYWRKLSGHWAGYQRQESALSMIEQRFAERRYKSGYWAAAWFFILADKQLRERHNTTLPALVKQYVACCRLNDTTLQDVIHQWDRLIGQPLFASLLRRFATQPASHIYSQHNSAAF
ncbi:hypothetical protein LJ739_10180 [Aestuariibacter halophilus]|uniref:Peptidase M61 catalytic domain-containing protein n=1 Tax=Fluctibacter halophilus TaxID=226011 RepID=A0ABS8G821_9ALTE|nr:hypothetical protein [Aestuariibacter halophilus]MCC2616609.1 hypothetical protein [Aestuariibacter halophilus]